MKKPKPSNFLVETAEQAALSLNAPYLYEVVLKELLHYDILRCLDRLGALSRLVFQGGTALRLCYGGTRFSEDLDFAGGEQFDLDDLKLFKEVTERHLESRYGLRVRVKNPNKARLMGQADVLRWWVAVEVDPLHRDVPHTRVKLEIANVKAYTSEVVPVQRNHGHLREYDDLLIRVESRQEIMADKIVAFISSPAIRYRDIWDMAWLVQQGIQVNADLVKHKFSDYNLTGFAWERVAEIDTIVNERAFDETLKPFIPQDTYKRTLADPLFKDYLVRTVGQVYDESGIVRDGQKPKAVEFDMSR